MAAGLINVVLLVYLIVKKRKKGLIFIISFGVLQALAYLPWLVSLLTQMNNVSNGFWIGFTFPDTVMELLSTQLAGYIKTSDYTEFLIPTVLALELYGFMIYKTYKLSKEKEEMKPFKWSVIIYLAVIIAAVIITLVMGSSILYHRYLFVITGLYIFAISFILGKEKNNVEVVTILAVIIVLGIYKNVNMIKDSYYEQNFKPVEYIEENIQEGDTIVYTDSDFGVGSVAAAHFEDNQVYFYNDDDWGVEEAYKAFGPNYETYINKDFLEKCSDRVWFIEGIYNNDIENVFENTDYKKVSEEQFYTKYHGYNYKITLMQKEKMVSVLFFANAKKRTDPKLAIKKVASFESHFFY